MSDLDRIQEALRFTERLEQQDTVLRDRQMARLRETDPDLAELVSLQLQILATDNTEVPNEKVPQPLTTRGQSETDFPAEVGHFELREELGRTNMSRVFRALDRRMKREVALKVMLSQGMCSKAQSQRFQREVRATAMLDHANIVKVFDVGELPCLGPYYSMELLPGEDLNSAMKNRQFSPREAVAIVQQCALALEAAHSREILHRDVKPHNIFLKARADTSDHGHLSAPHIRAPLIDTLIFDFGLAKLTESDTEEAADDTPHALTASGDLLGTPRYMAPEQWEDPRSVDHRADIYSLGATMYHMLTERPPFLGDSWHDLLAQVRSADPIRPQRLNHNVDRDVETLCLKCLERDPRLRYQSARALAEDCRRYLAGESLVARPVGPVTRLFRRARRNRAMLAALSAALLLGLSAAVGVYWRYVLQPRWEREDEEQRLLAEALTRQADARALLKQGQASLSAGHPDRAHKLALRLIGQYAEAFARGEELPVPSAHLLLARVASMRNQKQKTLEHLFRAYRLAAGRSERGQLLVEVGLQLERMGRFSDAQGCLSRALRLTHGQQRLAVRFALARCLASRFRFGEAHARFQALSGKLSGERFERWRRLVASMTPVSHHPIQFYHCVVRDIEGDGRPELVGIHTDGRQVVVGRFVGAVWKEIARRRLLTNEQYGLGAIEAIDLDGDGVREIVVTAGKADLPKGTGRLFVLALEGGGLVERVTAPLSQGVLPHTLAYGDLDGDGKKELLVGMSHYGRAVRRYHYQPKGATLKLIDEIELGSDVHGLVVRDANKNGRPELWVFLGPWEEYGLVGIEYDPARQEWSRNYTALGEDYVFADLDPHGSGLELLLGHAWSRAHLKPLWRKLGGRKAVERRWPAPGVQRLLLGPDLKARVIPLDRPPWPAETSATIAQRDGFHARRGHVGRLGRPEDRWIWTWVGCVEDMRSSPVLRLSVLEGGRLRHWGWLQPPSVRYLDAQAADLDGDGDLELIVLGGKAAKLTPNQNLPLVVHGLGKPGAARSAAGTEGDEGGAQAARVWGDASLSDARLAEQLGLLEQAAASYRETLEETRQLEVLQLASVGLVRILFAQRKPAEARAVARRLLSRHASLRQPIGRALLIGSERLLDWPAAHRAALHLLETPGLPPEQIARLRLRAQKLQRLARPPAELDERDRGWQLLAYTPLSGWRSRPGSVLALRGIDRCLLPLAMEADSYHLEVDLRITRKAWSMGLGIGLHTGGASVDLKQASTGNFGAADGRHRAQYGPIGVGHSLHFSSTGSSIMPVTAMVLWVHTERGRLLPKRYLLHLDDLRVGDVLQLRMSHAPHLRRLTASAKHLRTGREGRVTVENVPPLVDSPFLDVWSHATHTRTSNWGAFEVTRLRLRAGRVQVRPANYRARNGLDLLLLANGHALQGRRVEAKRHYEQAILAGDLERARHLTFDRAGLPDVHNLPWAASLRHVAVKARVWRAFYRWQEKLEGAALDDLRAAHQMESEVVKRLLLEVVPYLLSQPDRAGLMARFLTELYGRTDRTLRLRDWVKQHWSEEAARLLAKR